MTDNMICKQRFFYLSGKAEAPEVRDLIGHKAPSCDPFSCTDITLLTVTRRDKSSPQCHIRMTGD